ncbi:MAG: hypothetical protein ACYCYP_11820 [Leptospirales bacterium]
MLPTSGTIQGFRFALPGGKVFASHQPGLALVSLTGILMVHVNVMIEAIGVFGQKILLKISSRGVAGFLAGSLIYL